MFNVEEMEINAAFYELFENVFDEDFFSVLAKIRPSARVKRLKEKDPEQLTEEEQSEIVAYNLSAGMITKKYTSRVAYIGSLLYRKKYTGSYTDYMAWLASCDASDFLNPEITQRVWEKIRLDQNLPRSVKNA